MNWKEKIIRLHELQDSGKFLEARTIQSEIDQQMKSTFREQAIFSKLEQGYKIETAEKIIDYTQVLLRVEDRIHKGLVFISREQDRIRKSKMVSRIADLFDFYAFIEDEIEILKSRKIAS